MRRKRAQDWMPPAVHRSFRRVVAGARFAFYPYKQLLLRNRKLKGARQGRRAFLLATGPSINHENLALLSGEDCFTISNAFLHHQLEAISPLFQGFAPFHPPITPESYVEWLRMADDTLPQQTKILLGHSSYEMVCEYGLFPEREVHYTYLGAGSRCVDLTRPILAPQTGPLLLLPLMIYMGYDRIYLLGCDCTMLRDYGRAVANFYQTDQDIRKDTTESDFWSDVRSEIRATLNALEQFDYYRDVLAGTPTQIVNLSTDSWIDAFPTERLEAIL